MANIVSIRSSRSSSAASSKSAVDLSGSQGFEIAFEVSNKKAQKNGGLCHVPVTNNSEALISNTVNLMHVASFDLNNDEIEIQDQIGEGQFGLVYKGTLRGHPCAIKKLKGGLNKDSVEYQRLLLELTILTGVGAHPNIVGFFGACLHDLSAPLLVEEFVDGTDLEDYLGGRSLGFNLGRLKVTCPPKCNV